MENKFDFGLNKRGQLTIFVIVAIVIVIGIVAFFLIRGGLKSNEIPVEMQGVFSYYTSCIEGSLEKGLDIAGSQGGRIDAGEYVPGSDFSPFSNQLNFLGFPVGYWYYVSGNGVIKENVPSKKDISNELENFVGNDLENCDFSIFREQGFVIDLSEGKSVSIRIENNKVDAIVKGDLIVQKGDDRVVRENHEISVQSKFGSYYDLAKEIYEKQKEDAFLESYGIDVLRNYAPVDGTEIQCSPKIWKTREVEAELKQGLEENIGKLKVKGDYYTLNKKEDKYFVVEGFNVAEDESVRFIYSKNWPTKLEIKGDGVDNELMIAEAIGNQEGLGILGFCYVPYHYVYDLSFPVLIQISNNEDIFQFPVSIIIDNNVAREAQFSEESLLGEEEFDLCEFRNQDIKVRLFDVNLNFVDKAQIAYECFNQRCNLGEAKNGFLEARAPACVNGFLKVRAEGYAEKRQDFSSNVEKEADVVLDKENEVMLEFNLGGLNIKENAIIVFTKLDGGSVSAVLPDIEKVVLSEGEYEIRAYVYESSSITLPGSTKTQCTKFPKSGISGVFGFTKEECFDVSIPETKIENVLIGGGNGKDFFLQSELQKGRIVISGEALPRPRNIEELQNNFAAFEAAKLDVRFENV